MRNQELARVFEEIGLMSEFLGDNPFRVRAYYQAARTLYDLDTPIEEIAKKGKEALLELPGIGPDLADKILEFLATGRVKKHEELSGKVPRGVLEVMEVPGVGPKTARGLYEALGIDSLEKLKEALDPETRAEVEELTQYEEDEAGGLMTPEYVAVRASMTVEDVLRFLRRAAPDAETIYYLYVVDEEGRLIGVLSLRDLIVADPRTKVAEIMNPKVVYVRTDTDQEEVARLMADYDFTVLPVVDEEGRLVGIVTVDDVLDVLEEEATEDIHKLAAVDVPDLVYSQASPLQLWLARVRWLIILILTGMVTSSILQGFESVLEAVTALAFYVPVLIGTGGNTGNQSATLIIRALATRDLDLRDWRRVLFKETVVGSLLGLTLASVLLIKVGLDGYGPLIPVVGLSLFLLVLFANLVGSMLPMVLRRLGVDPALVSNPFIATLSDVIGLLIYLSVARLILGI